MTPEEIRLIEVLGYTIYNSCLVGNPCPTVENRLRRMRNPHSGDLVLEISTIWNSPGERDGDRLGRLEKVLMEPRFPEEARDEYGYDPDDPIPTKDVWYIRTIDGRLFRWTNASFIALPERIATTIERMEGSFGKDGALLG